MVRTGATKHAGAEFLTTKVVYDTMKSIVAKEKRQPEKPINTTGGMLWHASRLSA
jgi:hypothetical protein